MILLKAICKTMFSVFKILTFILFIFGLIIGFILIMQNDVASDLFKMGIEAILVLTVALLIGFIFVQEVKENYEMYLRKSTQTENTYSIDYKTISEGHRVIEGKTKQLATQKFYKTLENNDCSYKITKIKEIL